MAKSFLLAFLFASLIHREQNDPTTNLRLTVRQDSIAYIQKSIAFIKEIKQQDLSNENFILADIPFSFEYFDCIPDVLADTATYTKEELSFIRDKKYPSLKKWTKEFFINIKLISSDTLKTIFRDRWWDYYFKHIGSGFNTFSSPIFLRNDTYCLFYADHHCGGLCGGGQLTLYKKEKNKWIRVKSYCNWIS
jgi:hypothetical protein